MPCDVCRTCRGPVLKARKRLGEPPPGLSGGEALGGPTSCCASGLAGGDIWGCRRLGMDVGGAMGSLCALSASPGQYSAMGSSHRSCSTPKRR